MKGSEMQNEQSTQPQIWNKKAIEGIYFKGIVDKPDIVGYEWEHQESGFLIETHEEEDNEGKFRLLFPNGKELGCFPTLENAQQGYLEFRSFQSILINKLHMKNSPAIVRTTSNSLAKIWDS